MSAESVSANPASPVSGHAWDDPLAVETIVEVAKRIGCESSNLGLPGEDYADVVARCNRICTMDSEFGKFDSAGFLSAVLKRGNPKAKGYAAEIDDALQKRFPFVADIQMEPAPGNRSPHAGIAKAQDSQRPPPGTAATNAPQPEQQASGTIASPCGEAVPAKLAELVTSEPFSGLFPIRETTVAAIADDMQKHGFDAAHPVIVWAERNIVVDGHTRLQAAKRAGLTEVAAVFRKFDGEDEAVAFAIREQMDRRNMTDADYLSLVIALDKRRARGGDRRSAEAKFKASSQGNDSSAEATAKLIGASATRVENARAVIASGNQTLLDEVTAGKKSLNRAAIEVRAAKRPPKLSDIDESARVAIAALNGVTAKLKQRGELFSEVCVKLAELATEIRVVAEKAAAHGGNTCQPAGGNGPSAPQGCRRTVLCGSRKLE